MKWTYERIKAKARELRAAGQDCRVTDLIALASQNDPFYVGTTGEREKAQWFADLWERFGYSVGVHLRRVHYQLASQDPLVEKPDGTPYENTERDWEYLGIASKCARYLGLVDPAAFVDRRNPDPKLHAEYNDLTPSYCVSGTWLKLNLPDLVVDGYTERSSWYGPESELQPYLLEVWVEKTTMNDVLCPLCKQYSVNLVTGAGEMSITAAIDLVERVREAGRPCRIFYVSDFDPAGYGMPVSVARKLEFFIAERGLNLDIRLDPIALTRDQVQTYELPRQPIKESERRRGAFEDIHGRGAVELDALEALHPGTLTQVVRSAILEYYDTDVQREAEQQKRKLEQALSAAKAEALSDLEGDIEALEAELETLQQAVRERLDAVEVNLDNFPLPEAGLVEESNGVLFDSTRGYLNQLASYKARQNGYE
jgi:hypothetical protein